MGVKAINWTGGGEPTLNPHLGDAISLVGEKSKIKMGMFTNGTLLDKNKREDYEIPGPSCPPGAWIDPTVLFQNGPREVRRYR